MITINLKPGTKRQAAKGDPASRWSANACAALRDGGQGAGPRRSPAATWLAVVLVVGALYLQTNSRLDTLEPQMQHALSRVQARAQLRGRRRSTRRRSATRS